jgi:hypothetical protein
MPKIVPTFHPVFMAVVLCADGGCDRADAFFYCTDVGIGGEVGMSVGLLLLLGNGGAL